MSSDRKNSTWLAIQFILTMLFSLIVLKLNIDHYGKETFGIWILLASIWGFGTTLDFGFGTTIVKYISQYQDNKIKIDSILSSSIFVFLVNGILIFFIGCTIGFAVYFNNSSLIDPAHITYYINVFILLGLSFYLQYISLFFKAINEGLSNFSLTSRLTIIQSTILLLGVSIISIMRLNLIVLSFLYFSINFFMLLAYIIHFKLRIKKYLIKISLFNFTEVKSILGYSLSIQAMSVFYSLIDPIVKYMIGTYLSLHFISAYEIARKFALAVSGLFFATFRIMLPKASVLKSKLEINTFIANDVVKYSKMGIIYSGLVFGVFSLPIILTIDFVFGIREASLIFIILAMPEAVNNFGFSIYSFFLGTGKVLFLAGLQFINLLLVTSTLFLGFTIFHTSLGLIGYFISVIIGNVLMVLYLKKEFEISLLEFFNRVGIIKLFYLISLLFLAMLIINSGLFPLSIILLTVSFLSLVLFLTDFQLMFVKFISLTKNNNSF